MRYQYDKATIQQHRDKLAVVKHEIGEAERRLEQLLAWTEQTKETLKKLQRDKGFYEEWLANNGRSG